jgi:hypothetical protein
MHIFHMTDQYPDPSITVGGRPQWAEGSYEIKIVALINNTNGLGTTISKSFPVKGSQLFYVTYYSPLPGFYAPDVVTPIQYNLNLSLAAWDIKTNGVAWKIILSEIDPSQTSTQSQTISSTFAGNFGADFSKIGLKFGLAPTFNNSATYSLATQMDDDELGEAAMYFYEPIIVNDDIIPNHGPWFEFKDINTGWATLNIQPKKVFQ